MPEPLFTDFLMLTAFLAPGYVAVFIASRYGKGVPLKDGLDKTLACVILSGLSMTIVLLFHQAGTEDGFRGLVDERGMWLLFEVFAVATLLGFVLLLAPWVDRLVLRASRIVTRASRIVTRANWKWTPYEATLDPDPVWNGFMLQHIAARSDVTVKCRNGDYYTGRIKRCASASAPPMFSLSHVEQVHYKKDGTESYGDVMKELLLQGADVELVWVHPDPPRAKRDSEGAKEMPAAEQSTTRTIHPAPARDDDHEEGPQHQGTGTDP